MLTENEKAATYLGWKPCPDPTKWLLTKGHLFECIACGRTEPKWKDVHRPAPDLSDPRNYMKAVINLAKQGAQPSLEWLDYSDADPVERLNPPLKYWAVSIRGDGVVGKGMETDVDFPGRAVVKALAALYDAEHSK